jgi:acetyl-CoA C-acetyltransferase
MARLAIIDGVRTPIGLLGGALKELSAARLAECAIRGVLQRTGIDAGKIEEVILGCCGQSSDAPNVARVAALRAGLPVQTPAYTVQRNCASGMQALINALQNVAAGDADIQIVGGVESMSQMPFVSREMRFGQRLRHASFIDTIWEGLTDPVCGQIMGRTAENLVEEFGISRQAQDAYAVESHRRAFRAAREGRLKDEIVPVEVPKRAAGRDVAPELVTQDEGIDPAVSPQKLALYPATFKEGGTVTPGNSCQISDGAAALLVMSEATARRMGLRPLALVLSSAVAGVEPERMGIGPTAAIPRALARAELDLGRIDRVELNEAFAAQVIACERVLKLERERLNVWGGAIALGHPVGFTGARLVLTLARQLRAEGLRRGVAALCVGGGQGAAVALEAA